MTNRRWFGLFTIPKKGADLLIILSFVSTDTTELLKASFTLFIPSAEAAMIRVDKGFNDDQTIEYLEFNRTFFLIIAKLIGSVKIGFSSLSYQGSFFWHRRDGACYK
jgi:hypothetical protein